MREEIEVKIKTSSSTVVDLEEMDINDIEMAEIAEAIKTLRPRVEKVFLARNKIGDTGALAILTEFSQLPALQELDLQFNQLGKDGIKAIMTLKTLHHPTMEIALHANKISDVVEIQKMQTEISQKNTRRF